MLHFQSNYTFSYIKTHTRARIYIIGYCLLFEATEMIWTSYPYEFISFVISHNVPSIFKYFMPLIESVIDIWVHWILLTSPFFLSWPLWTSQNDLWSSSSSRFLSFQYLFILLLCSFLPLFRPYSPTLFLLSLKTHSLFENSSLSLPTLSHFSLKHLNSFILIPKISFS